MKRYLNLKTNKEGCNVLQNRVQLHCSKNFYLNTPMARKEYMRKMRLQDISQENIDHYELKSKVDNKNGFVYVEIGKGVYGLPQGGIIAQELLEKRLNSRGYYQSQYTHGLWMHKMRKIKFALVIDNFGISIKYESEEGCTASN